LEIAGILTEQAELCSTTEELDQSKRLLERAVEIYQKNIKTSQTNKQPFQYGKALIALGVTYGSLGEASRSKDLLEKGLMELQNAAPGDPQAKENKWFAAEISSAVTNLGHAYLSLGKINQGRKLLELALIGHQNVHGDAHQEVIRTLTTLSIAHAMQGNSQESKRIRNEAGKIKKKLDIKAPLFLH
jgi:tetratricopeptide (TPR) repeat protein